MGELAVAAIVHLGDVIVDMKGAQRVLRQLVTPKRRLSRGVIDEIDDILRQCIAIAAVVERRLSDDNGRTSRRRRIANASPAEHANISRLNQGAISTKGLESG